MKAIRWTSSFKSDYKKLMRSPRHRDVDSALQAVATSLANNDGLVAALRDHALVGNWKGFRECHLAPDLLLIYRHEGESAITFARLGTHSELFR